MSGWRTRVLAMWLALPVFAHAATYDVDLDSWLKESSPNEKHGTDVELSVKTASGDDMRAVLHYDISGIAADSNITNATAYFWVTSKDDSGDPVNVHRVTKNWNENSAKWNTLADDYDSTVSGSFTPTNDDVWVSVDITTLVQDWVCGTYTNHGVMLITTSNGTESKYASSEWSPSSQRPYLDVTTGAGSGCGPSPGHFSITHGGINDTCSAANVTLRKHDASHTVDTSFTGTVTLSTSSGNGIWTLVTGNGTLTDLGGGNATYAFAAGDNGEVVLGLSNSTEETLNIDVTDGTESEDTTEDADLTFSDSGSQTFRDEFGSTSFGNDDGTASWSNDWQEIGESDGAGSGDVRVTNDQSDSRLRIQDNNNGGEGVWREVDLSAYTGAALSFDYRRHSLDNANDYVAVEVYDGSSWTEITRFTGPNNDSSYQSFSQDITAYIAADTRVRLLGSPNLGNNDRVWFDNLEISASASSTCSSSAAASFAINHDGNGIHCVAESMSVTVLDATSTVVTNYDAPVTLTTQSGRGTWSLLTGNGSFVDATADDGSATYDFDPVDAGVATFSLSYPEGSSPIDADVYQSDDTSIRDDDTEGLLAFAPSGFTLTASALANPPPSPVDDPLGTQTAGTNFAMHITAYGVTDDDPLCGVIESYTGSKLLEFYMTYGNPGSGSRVATVDGSDVNTGTDQSVAFTAGQAQVSVKYKDVGVISLRVEDDDSFPAVVSGTTNDFIVRPAALVVSRIEAVGGAANPAANALDGPAFVAAGDAFVVDVEVRDAEGALAPNFGLETSPESVLVRSESLVLPVGGRNGSSGDVQGGAGFVASATPGRFTNVGVRFDEVGIITLRPALGGDGDYLGTGAVTGVLTGNVGRFYPASFDLVSGSVAAACTSYTYMDQPGIGVDYRVQARNSLGTVTENYDEGLLGVSLVASLSHVAEAADEGIDRGVRLSAFGSAWQSGEVLVNEPGVSFSRAANPDGPFDPLQLGLRLTDPVDGVALTGLNMNATTSGSCSLATDCNAHTLGAATRVVYGRLMVLPSFGPETRDLDVGLEAQVYDGSAFGQHTADDCSVYAAAVASLDGSTYSGNLGPGDTTPVAPAASTLLQSGAHDVLAPLTLSAPGLGNEGSVDVILDVADWLEFDWLGSGTQDPAGTATFGRYRGHDRIIFWQER